MEVSVAGPRTPHPGLHLAFSILNFALLLAFTPANAQDEPDLFRTEVPTALSSRNVSLRFEKL
ncbi:MAG TPA: hypothetical protein VJB15_08740, partial [Rhodothermia bacterium]|nr:hypothetical protein [Rhodothermia bacterium]